MENTGKYTSLTNSLLLKQKGIDYPSNIFWYESEKRSPRHIFNKTLYLKTGERKVFLSANLSVAGSHELLEGTNPICKAYDLTDLLNILGKSVKIINIESPTDEVVRLILKDEKK